MRKAKKDERKAGDGLLSAAEAEIKKLSDMLAQKNNLLRKADSDVSELNRQVTELTAKVEQASKSARPPPPAPFFLSFPAPHLSLRNTLRGAYNLRRSDV